MAKGMGGGMPIGAMCCTSKVATAMNPGSHGSTYAGSPVCCAASLAQIGEILDRKLSENAAVVGDYFAKKCESLPHVKEVRHAGLLVGIEFDVPNALDIKHGCIDRKMLVTAIGANIIRTIPPLIVTKEECDKAYDILKASVEALAL
jgi:acetylornithine/N-succinyldiaminopimelate aminotransferase